MHRNAKYIALLAIALIAIPSRSTGTIPPSARSMGMAGSYTVMAKDVEAAFWNPANLGLSTRPGFSLCLFSVSASISNNSFSLGDYNTYVGDFWDDQEKLKILNSIPAEGLKLDIDAGANCLGFSAGNFALTVVGDGWANLRVAKSPFEFLLFGNELNDTVSVSDSKGEAWAITSVNLSYGQAVYRTRGKELSFGLSFKYLIGWLYYRVIESQGNIYVQEQGINGLGNFVVQSAEGGRGFSIDLGSTYRFKNNWLLGLSVTNLFSQMQWNKNTEERGYHFEMDTLNAEGFDDDSVAVTSDYTKQIGSFNTRLPMVIRTGLGKAGKKLSWSLDGKEFIYKKEINSTYFELSLGAEYKLFKWLPLRSGVNLTKGKYLSLAGGMGLRFGPYYLDTGLTNHSGFLPGQSKGIGLAISSGFCF
jgi:hypothetical protein